MLKPILACFARCLAGLARIAHMHPGVIAVCGAGTRHS